jgi:DNA-binding NarL/FixJ family response regulator
MSKLVDQILSDVKPSMVTWKQWEWIILWSHGLSYYEIADEMGLTPANSARYRDRIMAKLRVTSHHDIISMVSRAASRMVRVG